MFKYSFSLELQWITGSSTFTLLYTVGVTLAALNDSIVRAAAYGYNDEDAADDDDDYQNNRNLRIYQSNVACIFFFA